MPYYPFGQDDVIRNTIKTFPKTSFYVYDEKVYYNAHPANTGIISEGQPINHVPVGNLSLYEYNVDRPSPGNSNLIYPFLVKNGTLISFKTVTDSDFNDMDYGETIIGSYNMSASITRNYYNGTSRDKVQALKNTMNYYVTNSPWYAYASNVGEYSWDKDVENVNLISIPSIFYGSQMKKGSLELNFYVSGILIGTLKDERQNGELIQTGPEGSNGSGSVAGVALYNEGFLVLTGSWDISGGTHTENYNETGNVSPSWLYYAVGAQDGISITSPKSAWSLDFRGVTRTQVVTMFANAPKGMINHSNNPTYVTYGKASQATGSSYYIEDPSAEIKNIVSSSYGDEPPLFNKETYISKIGIYDEHRNLIAIAKLATPVKKTEQRDLTFKLKLDI